MIRIKLNASSIIGIINALILIYAAWVKHEPSNCYFCKQTTYLPISDLTIAYFGISVLLRPQNTIDIQKLHLILGKNFDEKDKFFPDKAGLALFRCGILLQTTWGGFNSGRIAQ